MITDAEALEALIEIAKPENMAKLTEAEQAEVLEHFEVFYWRSGRDKFSKFCQMVEVPGTPPEENPTKEYYPVKLKPARHHFLLINAIQAIADGKDEADGLLTFWPPGAAKSTFMSVLAPAWLMGRRPGTNMISASYGQELANRFGRRVRTIARSPEFEKIMGCTITGDNQAVDNWSLTNGSDYRAAGMGAAVTGFRANYVGFDDPIRGREDADSDVIREKVWASLNDDLFTRLKPGGAIFGAMTRWHEQDPAGMILGEEWRGQSGLWRGTDGRLWRVINLPMIAEHRDDPLGRKPGEILWKEWFRAEEVERLRKTAERGGVAARTWSSLYQQRPAPAEGSILMRSYWKKWPEGKKLPECEMVFLAYDTALEEEEQNDPSAMTAWGVFNSVSKKETGEEYNHQHMILLGAWEEWVQSVDLADIIAGRKTDDPDERIRGHYEVFKPDLILVEKRASGHTVIQELKRRRLPVKAWLPKGKPGTKGKIPRAHGVAMMLESGSIWYVDGPRTQKVIDQCAAFPNGAHDDLVDTVTCALTYARDRFLFRTADEELDAEAHTEWRKQKIDQARPRRVYGSESKRPRIDDEDDTWQRMTSETRDTIRRRLYNNG